MAKQRFFMRDQLRTPIATIMAEEPRRASVPLDIGGAGLAIVVAVLTLVNVIAVAPSV